MELGLYITPREQHLLKSLVRSAMKENTRMASRTDDPRFKSIALTMVEEYAGLLAKVAMAGSED